MKADLIHADVLVIGGGPAGSAAAITAAGAGANVVLVEREQFPRHRPGETLAPGVEPLFRQLGVWDPIRRAGFIRHPGHWVNWGGAPVLNSYGGDAGNPWLGLQAWRPTLDKILLERAQAVGVTILQPCRALAPIVVKRRLAGLTTDHGEIQARMVIDASGRGEWLIRKLQLPQTKRSPRLIASYGYLQTAQAANWFVPHLEAEAQDWTWTAQIRRDVVAWTRLSVHGALVSSPPAFPGLVDAHPIEVGVSTADVTWRCSRAAAGPGWFIVGDAALVLDPASSHGVLRALMSGIMAADLGGRVLRDELPEPVAVEFYQRWLGEWFERDASALESSYQRLPTPPSWLARTQAQSTNPAKRWPI